MALYGSTIAVEIYNHNEYLMKLWLKSDDCFSLYLRWGWHRKAQFGFFAIVNGEFLHQQSSQTRSSASAKGVENDESLQTHAIFRQFSQFVHAVVNLLFANGVVASSVVISGIFLSRQ